MILLFHTSALKKFGVVAVAWNSKTDAEKDKLIAKFFKAPYTRDTAS
jgi:hypothetical protein